MFLFKAKKTKVDRYYREYLACWGWGVMLAFDSVWAQSSSHAREFPQRNVYIDRDFEGIYKVKDEHLPLTDGELSKLYGHQE